MLTCQQYFECGVMTTLPPSAMVRTGDVVPGEGRSEQRCVATNGRSRGGYG